MPRPADSFGYIDDDQPTAGQRAANAFDRLVTFVIVVVLIVAAGLSGYSLWDSYMLAHGGATYDGPTRAERFAEARAMNPDVIAWLTVDNTGIDYPVVQGKDNFEYLTKDATGEYSASGSLFLDYRCDPKFHEPYEVIMGHHMEYSKMFGDLDKFLDQSFFEQNSSAELLLPKRTLELEIVAVMQADAYNGTVFGMPASSASGIVSYTKSHAVWQRKQDYSSKDQIIGLSTCDSSGVNERTVVLCKVVKVNKADNA
ncbi:MAG: class B sortase [Coriobacteriales bacterium]